MSTTGSGAVVATGAIGAGIVVGGLVIAGAAIVGTGILIGKGLVWCGQKLEENYQSACREYTQLAEAARAENFANVQVMGDYLADQLDYLSASAYLTINMGDTQTPQAPQPRNGVDAQAIAAVMAQTKKALADAQVLAQSKADTAQDLLSYRLQAEIQAGRGILSAAQIAAAEDALHASPEAMRQALDALQAAWQQVSDQHVQNERDIRQARQIIQSVHIQLAALEKMLLASKSGRNPGYIEQQRIIEAKIQEAQPFLDVHPATALTHAQEAHQAVRKLVDAVAAATLASSSATRREANTQQGILTSLTVMLEEAKVLQEKTALSLLDPRQLQDLTRRVEEAQSKAKTLIEGQMPDTPQRLQRLKTQVALLKEDVFALVKTGQQRTVAQTIADTLKELGFSASNGGQPVLKQNGDTMRIEAMVDKATSGAKHDEKVVSFDISPEGAIAYDFSGYAGESCVHDAKTVFDALKAKGVFILDDRAQALLEREPTANITAETLQQERFQPHISKNKTQAELADALKRVLEKMQFTQVQESVVGGFIELDAFNGNLGYHVVLPPDDSEPVLQDRQHKDISSNTSDPVVVEVQRVMQQAEEGQQQEQEPSRQSAAKRQQKRQMMGHS